MVPRKRTRHNFPNVLFKLHEIGCRKFRSFIVSCTAALMRTALQTVTNWPNWKLQLEMAAGHALSIGQICAGKLSPHFWDSPPIAANLAHAFFGFPGNRFLGEGARRFYSEMSAKYPEIVIEPGSFVQVSNLQSYIYRNLLKYRFQTNLQDLVKYRICKLFEPFVVDNEQLQISDAFRIMRQLRAHDAIRILKTWTNALCTSARFHEEPTHP